MGANDDFFDFLRSISAGKGFGELYLRQLIDASYEVVFAKRPSVQDLQSMYALRNSPQHEAEWKQFLSSMEVHDLLFRNTEQFFDRFVIPAAKELFPSFFRKSIRTTEISFAIREFINEKGPAHLRRNISGDPLGGFRPDQKRPIDLEALEYVNQLHKSDSTKFTYFMEELIYFITSRRPPGSIGTVGSFWDHFLD